MTSSADRRDAIGPLPPALSSMWRLCVLGYRHEPRLMIVAFVLSQLAALPDPLLALWLAPLGKGVLEHRPGMVRVAAVGLAVSATATWFLRTVSTRVQRRFRDKVTIALEAHVARLQATVPTIAHHERPDYLDRLSVLREQVFVLDHMYMSVFSTAGWILRLGVTISLLMAIHPALVLLVLFAAPTAAAAMWRPGVERGAQEKAAPFNRLARHLFMLATTASPASFDRARATCCSCSPRARGCRCTSAPPSARSASSRGSGPTAPGGSPGSKTTRRRCQRRRIFRRRRG